ncbi:MAG: hypothetical protein K1X35_10635 [Caulobacteraceae bacterium]|nr:hypothetical protein [Caulobacteraceae bacterium]
MPFWLWSVALALPATAVLVWFYWGPLTASLGPSVIPALSPVLPHPPGAPGSVKARYDPEQGVVWYDCLEAAGGQVRAEWWRKSGLYRVWIRPNATCASLLDDETPGSLRLVRQGAPVLVLERLTAAPQASRRRDLCNAAHARGLGDHTAVARALSSDPKAGLDLRLALSGFAAAAPGYRSARPGGTVISSQLCNFRTDPPPSEDQTSGYMGVDMSLTLERP